MTTVRVPTPEELSQARQTFSQREPRDLFYRAATELVQLAWTGAGGLSLAEAIGVLLQTWNVSFYRFHQKFDADHFKDLEALIEDARPSMGRYRSRCLSSLEVEDERDVEILFVRGEAILGPVGTAKSYHLLAPEFFPIWDRSIAKAYGCSLGARGSNSKKYVRFMQFVKGQLDAMQEAGYCPQNPLKALDEYNYCRFTNRWLVE